MVEGSREAGTPTWIRRGSTMLTMRGTPAGWSLLTGSSAWALHHSPRAVLAMLVLELAGLAVLQWQHGRLQAGSRQGAQAIVEILPIPGWSSSEQTGPSRSAPDPRPQRARPPVSKTRAGASLIPGRSGRPRHRTRRRWGWGHADAELRGLDRS